MNFHMTLEVKLVNLEIFGTAKARQLRQDAIPTARPMTIPTHANLSSVIASCHDERNVRTLRIQKCKNLIQNSDSNSYSKLS